MDTVFHDIFRAVHEGKWLSIAYRNQEGEVTRYWIGIRDLDTSRRTLSVEGFHLTRYTVMPFDAIYLDSILSSQVIEGSYYPVPQKLVTDIRDNPHKYQSVFSNTANLKILSYLEMCSRMDTVPYYTDYALVRYLDRERLGSDGYVLNQEQFQTIVQNFQYQTKERQRPEGGLHLRRLAMNVVSIHTPRGLYPLAYRHLNLDVKRRMLVPDEDLTICTEFTLEGVKQNVRRFLDGDEYELLADFEENQEEIKDCITGRGGQVDDMPYLIGLGMDVPLDLHREYASIMKLYQEQQAPVPIRAFFGDLLERPRRRGAYPIALINHNINLDQLLAIHNAMKYPIAYIQGPPGTGKTNTIINTIVTAFFNERTVLFASYNNHPINGVCEKLSRMRYRDQVIPFPMLRLGNQDKVREALKTMERLYQSVRDVKVYESTLDRNRDDRKHRARKLSELLRRYEERLELRERRETLETLAKYEEANSASLEMLAFQTDLTGRQKRQIERRLERLGEVSEEEALSLLDDDLEELKKYLYYTSARYIKKLDSPQNRDLLEIIQMEDEKKRMEAFGEYLKKKENVAKLQKIFPVIATTCISAHRLGEPEPMFDMVIMDEASQCNTAVSLVPILRGENLMLVGDPQQLSPVILLDEAVNEKLKKRYGVSDAYDYRKNSVYKTFLACDAVSDEILLHNHYRCNRRIIEFNNRKFYSSKLNICSESQEKRPLVYVDVENDGAGQRNTAPEEVRAILDYVKRHPDQSIGIITPFVNQKNLINEELETAGVKEVTCGTVHAFQGDEKDVILFSTALTDQTREGTYGWLKNNKELINVATSRAKDRLIVFFSGKNLERLHREGEEDDLYELVSYVRSNGATEVTPRQADSRALGVKPFSTATEEAFLQNLTHALESIWLTQNRYHVYREVPISQVFADNTGYNDLFYTGRFDFVVYMRQGEAELPVLAIELDGKEHLEDAVVMARDRKKEAICAAHHLQMIRVENSYARRYNYMKDILISYFSRTH